MTDRAPAWSLAVAAIVIVQLGVALSPRLIEIVGPAGTGWLRLTAGGLMLLAIVRPKLRSYSREDLRIAVLLGVITGVMMVAFLGALDRLPLGTTVAIEFLGPLTVAAFRAHRRSALLWPALALAGVVVLTEPWVGETDTLGIVLALIAGAGWGSYILLTQSVGDRFNGLDGLAITIPIAAITAAIPGIPQAWGHITVGAIALAVGLAAIAPVIPFALEVAALRRLSAATFGTLMALEPAIGTLWGAILLSQIPNALQIAGIALVVVAGIGAERAGRSEPPAPNPLA
ncbi:MAG: EamA family transporter [Gaiellales bacterium]